MDLDKRHLVLWKKDYAVEFDYIEEEDTGTNFIIAHINIYKWNKTVRLRVLKDCIRLADMQELPLYVTHTPGDTKHLKFITMLGFVKAPVDIENDEEHLYVWRR